MTKKLNNKYTRALALGLTYSVIVCILAIVFWESRFREPVMSRINTEPIVMERSSTTPKTMEEFMEEKARSWLKTPEAFEYAMDKVTEEVIDDLSKI